MALPKSERFEVRLDEDILARIDGWRGEQADLPTRAEAMRRLVESGLMKSDAVKLSPGDKLTLSMLCDISKHLKIGESGVDPDFVENVISGGHYWALEQQLPHIFHDHEDRPEDVRFVVDDLDMWSFIETAYKKLSKKEKDQIANDEDVRPFGNDVRFRGFDGNNEPAFVGIARFLIEKLGRFSAFEGRDLNSHSPRVAVHQRMLRVFGPMRAKLVGVDLSASQLVMILAAQKR